MDVSVVIVNFNCASHVESCVKSLRQICGPALEIIVVDNASEKFDIEQLRCLSINLGFVVIESAENRGFAAGSNLGAKAARSRWIHFLNPDCTVDAGILNVYKSIGDLSNNAIYTTRMRDGDGSIRGNVYAVPKFRNLVRASLKLDFVEWAQGSSILITADKLQSLGGWDESYFMYAEDLDLCYRAQLHGLPLRVLDTTVTHVGGGSSGKVWTSAQRERRTYRAQRRFFEKHGSLLEYVCVMPLLIMRGALVDRKIPVNAICAFFGSLSSSR